MESPPSDVVSVGESVRVKVTSIITDHLSDSVAAARAAEAAGYDGVTTQENQHDPFLPLAAAAVATERVSLITSIALAFATRRVIPALFLGWTSAISGGAESSAPGSVAARLSV